MAKRSRAPARMEEVTDLQAESPGSSGLTLEAGVIFATFMALLVAIILAQMCMGKYFDGGMFG